MKSLSWTEIDSGILRKNIRELQNIVSPATEIIFVVKSNAYGHGIVSVSKCAWDCGIRWFAVANLSEALLLRNLLPEAEILIIGVIHHSEAYTAAEANINVAIVSERHAQNLNRALLDTGLSLRCHIKIDTGMGRLGLWYEDAARSIRKIAKLKMLKIDGLFTHFALSYELQSGETEKQAVRFRQIVEECKQQGLSSVIAHASNSAAILRNRTWDFNAVRPGLLLYGYSPFDHSNMGIKIPTQPFLSWKSCVLQIKHVPRGFRVGYGSTYITDQETQIATIGVGYANGYSRLLSNKGKVIIKGKVYPVVGIVNMNFICVDIGLDAVIQEWDEVTLIGTEGKASIWADEIAHLCGTIPYEVLTSIKTDLPECINR